jgi:uncharacterized membrane protein YqjE
MIERLSNAATIAVRHAGAYADLLQSDLDVSSRVVRRRVIVASVMGAALLLAVGLACVGVIAAAWDTPQRMWAIGGLLGLFVLIAAVAFWKYRALDADAPPLLSQTAGEWSKDRRLLEELLARVPPEAS